MRIETLEQIRKALAPVVAGYGTPAITVDIRTAPSKEGLFVVASTLDKSIELGFEITVNGLPHQTAPDELERSLSRLVKVVEEAVRLSAQSARSVH